ncbi:MAG: 3-oxoacyl-[acyl-carrier-protein] reductase [bacterium]|nr:3-oxoacyl-[acyl-carrier-protein] reductase [bacterium]
MKELQGQVALVTGGGRGIGESIARHLAQSGAHVVCSDVADPASVVEAIRAEGGSAEAMVFDVTDHKATAAAVQDIVGSNKRLDIVVNNAGITRDGLIVRMKPEDWSLVLKINLEGAFNVSQAAAKIMMRQRSGRIINISSVVGLMGNVGQANYSSSKAGLVGLTKSLAKELGSRNITVNAIAPGYIETAMTDQLDERQREALLKSLAIQRLGQPQDVADAVSFLAGPHASYITGTVINVSGGLYI